MIPQHGVLIRGFMYNRSGKEVGRRLYGYFPDVTTNDGRFYHLVDKIVHTPLPSDDTVVEMQLNGKEVLYYGDGEVSIKPGDKWLNVPRVSFIRRILRRKLREAKNGVSEQR